MSRAEDVSDSTDWLSTPLCGFVAVETALRCQVCKDFYKTPMITSCSHTFCSICIRRALSNDGKCPLCRNIEQEVKLRSNWSMEETVDAFVKTRVSVLNLAHKITTAAQSPKRKADGDDSFNDVDLGSIKRLRTSARLSQNRGERAITTIPRSETSSGEGLDTSKHALHIEVDDGLVPCPMCKKRMMDWQVFNHLESCPGSGTPESTGESKPSVYGFGQTHRTQEKTHGRLPPLNYSMIKEHALRKKMAELGISNQGPRALLERRHKEWLTLWNANCDAALPKKRPELLHDLDVWERTQGGRVPPNGRAAQSAVMIKDKEFDGAAWAARHSPSFKDLIANAKKSRLASKTTPEIGDGILKNKCIESIEVPASLSSEPTLLLTIHEQAVSQIEDLS